MLNKNPLHDVSDVRNESTKVSISNEDLESTELDNLLKKVPQYEPRFNGHISESYVEVTAKIQYETKVSGEKKKVKVFDSVVEARKKRIVDSDRQCFEKARERVYCGDRNICEEAIKRYGDEIIATMNCVALLNAPQTNTDFRGDGKLYLTRRKSKPLSFPTSLESSKNPPHEPYMQREYTYRLFYYYYGEDPSHRSVEKASDVFDQILKCFENDVILQVSAGSTTKVTTEDNAHRGALGAFVTLSLDDLIAAHHRVSDTTDMRRFVDSEAKHYQDSIKWDCECLKFCAIPCIACSKLCAACTCEVAVAKHSYKQHEWMLRASENLDSINQLVTGYAYDSNFDKETVVLNPLNKTDTPMATTTTTELNWRRFHTLNFNYLDRDGDCRKRRCVVVMDPHEDAKQGIDMVCHLTSLLDDRTVRERSLQAAAVMDSRDPLLEHAHLLRTNSSATSLLSDALLGNIDIHLEVAFYYRINNAWLLLLAFICLCVSFALVGDNLLLILNGLYSTMHFLDRIYNFRNKEFNRRSVIKDLLYGLGGLLFTITGSLEYSDGGSGASIAFTFLQGFFAVLGTSYQLIQHYRGVATKPLFETGQSVKLVDNV